MKKLTLVAIILIAAFTPSAFGQGNVTIPAKQVAPSADAYGNERSQNVHDARLIRATRDKAVARTGGVARRLIEEHAGAVAALNACTPEVGKKLASAFNEGVLDKLKIDALLIAVASTPGGGDDTALWMIQPDHAAELQDADTCGAFCQSPLDAALAVRPLSEMAAEYRANRLTDQEEKEKFLEKVKRIEAQQPASAAPLQEMGAWAAVIGFIALVIAILYAAKRLAGGGKQNYPLARRDG